jgi:hypothetical protein
MQFCMQSRQEERHEAGLLVHIENLLDISANQRLKESQPYCTTVLVQSRKQSFFPALDAVKRRKYS